jgi:hypothetical protein
MNYETAIKAFLSGEKTDPDFIKQCFWELKAECDSYAKRIARWRILGWPAGTASGPGCADRCHQRLRIPHLRRAVPLVLAGSRYP